MAESNESLSAPKRRWTELSLENYDLALLLFIPLYAFLIAYPGLPFSWWVLQVFFFNSLKLLGAVVLLTIVSLPLRYWHAKQTNAYPYSRNIMTRVAERFFTPAFAFRSYRRIWVIFGAIFLFLHLKHLILWWHPVNMDKSFWDLDRTLHFGVQPNIWAMQTFGLWPGFAVAVDWLYFHYFQYMLIVSLLFLLEIKTKQLSDQYFFAFALLWFIGGLLYLAFPADGPCYAILGAMVVPPEHQHHVFAFPVTSDIPASYVQIFQEAKIWYAKIYQERLWLDRQAFLEGTQGPGVFYGIQAMPSLHVATVVLLAVYLFRLSVLAGIIGAVYAGIVFFGSVFLQWHYAVDGYAGALLGIALAVTSAVMPNIYQRCRRTSGR